MASFDATINSRILEEAADWMVQLSDGKATAADRAACENWRQRSPEHAQAWARAERLMHKFGGLPPALAMPALNRVSPGRRAAVAKLALLLAAMPAGWFGWQLVEEKGWAADYRTALGERRDIQLADGTRVTLNTQTAIDVRFDATQRTITLREGEILVQTAPDTVFPRRPISVQSVEGGMEALGTRFSVREEGNRTHLVVLEGAVRITPKEAPSAQRILQAGEQTSFTDSAIGRSAEVDDAAVSWTHGMLMADRMRIADFAAELERYRRGIVRVEPEVANLRVSGAFPVDDTDQALAMLVSTVPVDAVTRLGGRWITLVARQESAQEEVLEPAQEPGKIGQGRRQ